MHVSEGVCVCVCVCVCGVGVGCRNAIHEYDNYPWHSSELERESEGKGAMYYL